MVEFWKLLLWTFCDCEWTAHREVVRKENGSCCCCAVESWTETCDNNELQHEAQRGFLCMMSFY